MIRYSKIKTEMGIENWFMFRSQADIEKNRKAYEAKVFPFGQKQKEHIEGRLKAMSSRVSLNEAMYMYLTYREYLADGEADGKRKDWYKNVMGKDMSLEEKDYVRALAELDHELQEDDPFVSDEQIKDRMKVFGR